MRADNSRHLAAAAQHRSERTRTRAREALRRMHSEGETITVEALAREAGVARSWIYGQPDLRVEIERLRPQSRGQQRVPVPAGQRASDGSLRRRLDAVTARAQQLESENRQLRHALAAAPGERRAADVVGDRSSTPGRAKLYGPC